MAISYTWTIPTVERTLSDGGITVIHWRSQLQVGTMGFLNMLESSLEAAE